MHQLDPSIKTVWSLNSIGKSIFYSILILIFDYFILGKYFENFYLKFGVLSAFIFIIGLSYSLIYPVLKYKYWLFDIRDKEIYLEYGVLAKVKTFAPFRRIQHIDVRQSILERMLDLSKLVVYTAGTRGSAIVIPGLPIEYAEHLRDNLKQIIIDESL